MPWVRFTGRFDWRPAHLVRVTFTAGAERLVTTRCAKAAVAAGKAEWIKRPDGQPRAFNPPGNHHRP